MESKEDFKTKKEPPVEFGNIERKILLRNWLTTCGLTSFSLQVMSGGASLRHYFRVSSLSHTYVLMDAGQEKKNCYAFVAIANALRDLGVYTPDIIAADFEQGFLLLTDFGDLTYLQALTADNADLLYRNALSTLALLQGCRHVSFIAPFTRDYMMQEWKWHKEWFLTKLLKLPNSDVEAGLDQCYRLLVEAAVAQPQVFMHRDYHSANLMVLPENRVGILDFQDAFIGPIAYDAVSLLRDCYIDWPKEQVMVWAASYLRQLTNLGFSSHVDEQDFLRWFDWMGMQRHLKALLTFARKFVQDGQSHYLRFVPRTLTYLINISQSYSELAVLHEYFKVTVQPAFERVYQCEQ